MQRRKRLYLILAVAPLAGPVGAQPAPTQALSQMASGDVASAAQKAIEALPSAAKDKLLVKDLLGAQVIEPGGSTVGIVEDLVVIPGGRVIAAIISTAKDTGRIPIPFAVVKVSHSAGKLGLTLPVSISELRGMKEIQSLRKHVPGLK